MDNDMAIVLLVGLSHDLFALRYEAELRINIKGNDNAQDDITADEGQWRWRTTLFITA
jgi:hypothetical protein